MRPAREDITSTAHVLTHDLPLRLRKLYPVHVRAMLQSLRIEELVVHGPYEKEQRIVLPRTLGRFSRRSPSIPLAGLGDPLPEEINAFSLVLDYVHDPIAYRLAGVAYGLRLRLRYLVDKDLLEGHCGFWPAPLPDGTSMELPALPVSAVFHLSYVVPY
jgi:hypothetical protein